MLHHSEKLNPCKCGSTKTPDLDSDDMVPCWGVNCYDCGQFQHGADWGYSSAVKKWNEENKDPTAQECDATADAQRTEP